MWYKLLAEIFFLSIYTILRTPKDWFKNKTFLIAFIIFHFVGISSVVTLLWHFYKIDNQLLKNIIIFVETTYFSFIIFSFGLSLYRDFIFYATRHVRNMKLRNKLLSPITFWSIVTVLSLLYLIPGIRNTNDIIKTTYYVESDKLDNFRIAMVSDLHVGAGANTQNLDDMVRIVNDMNADCLVICGDVVDSSSSINDLKCLKQSLLKINTKQGIYIIDGNHDEQCHYDYKQYLIDGGAIILNNNLCFINNEIVVVGISDEITKSVSEIKKENNVDNQYTIVLKHNPKHFNKIKDDTDLVLCGHTHGYQYPFTAVTAPFFEVRQGMKAFDNMIGITSCGLSQWGYHSKWPSHSEVVEIIVK